MPKELESKLRREARKKGLVNKRANAYVYGTLRKIQKKNTGSPFKTYKKG